MQQENITSYVILHIFVILMSMFLFKMKNYVVCTVCAARYKILSQFYSTVVMLIESYILKTKKPGSVLTIYQPVSGIVVSAS